MSTDIENLSCVGAGNTETKKLHFQPYEHISKKINYDTGQYVLLLIYKQSIEQEYRGRGNVERMGT